MSNDDDALQNKVATRLQTIRTSLGTRTLRAAARRALVDIAKAALAEGERRAARHNGPESIVKNE
jgi:hypothetical protein